MCGRYVRKSDKQRIADHFHLDPHSFPDLGVSYNVAPQTFQPIIRLNRDTGSREIVLMRWGLLPFWAKQPKVALSTINAKAETIATAPAFREAFRKRRCLVPADAFYEWQKIAAKTRQPFAIAMKDGSPYAFAGLWERWRDPATKEPLETLTIITTDPNELMDPLHNRMPVILAPKDYDRWLAPSDPAHPPIDLLRPYPAEQMNAWKVDTAVGNVRNDTEACIAPLTESAQTEQLNIPGLVH
jgi:putative SOS response-associated peptidase YedK